MSYNVSIQTRDAAFTCPQSFPPSPCLPRLCVKRWREILTCNGVLQAKIVLRGVSSASGFSLFTLTRDVTCRLDSSLGVEREESRNANSRCGGKEEYSLLEERIYQNTWHHKIVILIFTAMKTTVEKFLLLIKNEHRLSSPYSYERLFSAQFVLFYGEIIPVAFHYIANTRNYFYSF